MMLAAEVRRRAVGSTTAVRTRVVQGLTTSSERHSFHRKACLKRMGRNSSAILLRWTERATEGRSAKVDTCNLV